MSWNNFSFASRRSVVVCKNGCVASSQPLASQCGLEILRAGGNAADAAVAVAAALNVTEPCSTGIGGDAFCLFYNVQTRTVKGINGSGRAPAELSLELLQSQGFGPDNPLPQSHGHAVTVPGAAAAWVDTVGHFGSGKLSLSQILHPAIQLAKHGFPVQEVAAHSWNKGADLLKDPDNPHGQDLLLNGEAPQHGEIMTNPNLANTFQELCSNGKNGFYDGWVAKAVVEAVQAHSGVMTLDDMQSHESTLEEPISVDFENCRVWEMPPNGQGLTALLALNILQGLDIRDKSHNSAEYLHLLIEALRLSFADAAQYCADPCQVSVPISDLLSADYAAQRRNLIDPCQAREEVQFGCPVTGSDTVYFTVADKQGNACSFINSNYHGFGTGIVPEGCGFTLQNRGSGFSLEEGHLNVVGPGKRPYHTIIPCMVTDAHTGDLLCSMGVMGGFMQPQGHVQVLLNMALFGMNPQQALDAPRFCIGDGYSLNLSPSLVLVEEGVPEEELEKLRRLGHEVQGPVRGWERCFRFGRGQVITRGSWWSRETATEKVYWAGSDSRADGCVAGY